MKRSLLFICCLFLSSQTWAFFGPESLGWNLHNKQTIAISEMTGRPSSIYMNIDNERGYPLVSIELETDNCSDQPNQLMLSFNGKETQGDRRCEGEKLFIITLMGKEYSKVAINEFKKEQIVSLQLEGMSYSIATYYSTGFNAIYNVMLSLQNSGE